MAFMTLTPSPLTASTTTTGRPPAPRFARAVRGSLIAMLVFGAVSAFAGAVLGVALNGAGVPLRYLDGSPFDSYVIPGLLLGVVVGGTQAVAVLALVRRHVLALLASTVAGVGMLVWIFVELAMMLEYSILQTLYFALGLGEVLGVLGLLGLLRPLGTRMTVTREPPQRSHADQQQ